MTSFSLFASISPLFLSLYLSFFISLALFLCLSLYLYLYLSLSLSLSLACVVSPLGSYSSCFASPYTCEETDKHLRLLHQLAIDWCP